MKKTRITLAIVLLLCIIGAFALTSCGLSPMDGTEYFDSTEKERSVQMVNDFFEETLKETDFVVTCKNKDGEVQSTETVNGADLSAHDCSFMRKDVGIGIADELSEENATFHCKTRIDWVEGFATGTLDFTYTSDIVTVTITASYEGQKVQTARVIINDAAEVRSDLTWTFVYGGAE